SRGVRQARLRDRRQPDAQRPVHPARRGPAFRAEVSQGPVSASRLAELLADQLPSAESIPPESFELVERVRELMDAVVLTDAPPEARAAAAARIAEITSELRAVQRE